MSGSALGKRVTKPQSPRCRHYANTIDDHIHPVHDYLRAHHHKRQLFSAVLERGASLAGPGRLGSAETGDPVGFDEIGRVCNDMPHNDANLVSDKRLGIRATSR
ncbi:hypothetical protein [Mycobacterium riyadhense]|uniref:hypothetical protein n=1 Tax=Mycobacterium riyadhense TaxID=486698 RepID=UPI0026D83D8F